MGDIVQFKPLSKNAKKKKNAEKSKGTTLCRHGHHKWKVVKENQFDVKKGKLVTIYECERCGKRKTELR